jgi:hypothetical protein
MAKSNPKRPARSAKRSGSKRAKVPRASSLPAWHHWWDGLEPRGQHLVCALALLVVSVGFYAPLHFSGKELYGTDTVKWRAMAESVIGYEEATGERPLWATNPFGGMPATMVSYGTVVPQADTVFSWLRRIIWPTSHLFVLLLGTYGFVWFTARDKLSAVLAACAFGLTTYLPVILVAGHNSKFITLAYAPWLMWAFAYALRRPKLLASLLFAAALAVNLRAGHVQITYYVAFVLGIWWLVELVQALRKKDLAPFGMSTAWLALGSVLGLLMVAQPYLMNAEYKAFTIRGAASGAAAGEGGLAWDYAMAWSQGWGELVTLFVAGAYGGGGATYWGPKIFTAGPHYIGGIAIALAVLALWRVRKNLVVAGGVATLLMLLFAVGEYFPALNRLMFDYFPLFDAFRVPETWLVIVALALAVLAGLGLAYAARPERFTPQSPQPHDEASRSLLVAFGGALALAVVLWLGGSALFDFEKEDEAARIAQQVVQQQPELSPSDPRVVQFAEEQVQQAKADRVELFASDALRTVLFLAAALALALLYRRRTIPAWTLQAALALLIVLDLGGVGRRYFNEDVLVRASEPEDQIQEFGFDRFVKERVAEAGGPGRFRTLSLEGAPSQTGRPAYHYETVSGYHGAKLRRIQDYFEHILPVGGVNENAVDLLSTRYVIAPQQLPGYEVAYRDEQTGFFVLENPDALPRAFLVGQTEVVSEVETLWQRITDPSFEPRQVALLESPLEAEVTPIGPASTASVTLERFTPDEIVWTVETDAPRLLVASELYYPAGWTATVSGEDAPIVPVDYLLRGVPIPAGEHEVVMRFAPRSHTLGVTLAATSTALVYGGIFLIVGMGFARRRRETA